MSGFQDVVLVWRGTSYPVPANKLLGLVVAVEDALCDGLQRDAIIVLLGMTARPQARLAAAYAAALRYAGKQITGEQVYYQMCEEHAAENDEFSLAIQGYIADIITLINPPMAFKMAADIQKQHMTEKQKDTVPQHRGLVRDLHRLCVAGKITTPDGFWNMPPGALWWAIEDSMPEMFDIDRGTRYQRAEQLLNDALREADGE